MRLHIHLRGSPKMAMLIAFAALSAWSQVTGISTVPNYTADGIVNAATQTAEALAPNAIATLYGTNLSYTTRAVSSSDLAGGSLPTSLDGVSVTVNAIPCGLFFISPTQINFLVPYDLTSGKASVIVARYAIAGPSVKIQLTNTSPGFFLWNGSNAVAVHLNGQLVSTTAPAAANEVIVLYAGGLGRTTPNTTSGRLATNAATILYASQLQILLNGSPIPPECVLYAGLTPGFAGLYQINLRLPVDLPANPEIRVAIGPQISPASVQLFVQ
jgi:uncharacterized protein (TIGR03437 family)